MRPFLVYFRVPLPSEIGRHHNHRGSCHRNPERYCVTAKPLYEIKQSRGSASVTNSLLVHILKSEFKYQNIL